MSDLYKKIWENYNLNPASHMTHLENLDRILKLGGLTCFNRIDGKYTSIANDEVQMGRSGKVLSISHRNLHDYVPLYFGFKTPMVACNQHINESLIFLRFSLNIMNLNGLIFSDGNARSHETKFFIFDGIDALSNLNIKAINSVKYAYDREFKRQKQSEILIPDFLSINYLLDIIVFSQDARSLVLNKLKAYDRKIPVRINQGWYFKGQK